MSDPFLVDDPFGEGTPSPASDTDVGAPPEAAPGNTGSPGMQPANPAPPVDVVDGVRSEAGEGVQIPEGLRAAMEASGVDPDEVAAKLAATGDSIVPTDEEEAFRQAAAQTGRLLCEGCKTRVDPSDVNVLREVIGWSKPRMAGGQNHVIDRAETGRVLCVECGSRLQHLGATGFAQESML